jgi:hypothetical protein
MAMDGPMALTALQSKGLANHPTKCEVTEREICDLRVWLA